MKKIKEILKKVRLMINKCGSKCRYKNLKIKNPTIISNNCWGGIVSQYLGIKYYTPTVGLYFFSNEYIKFLKKFRYYVNQKIEIIDTSKSKYYEELKKKGHEKSLVGKLDDVEIVFLHYKSASEIREKWKKRVKRINWDYIIFKFNDQNLCEEKFIKDFDELPYKNKICFSTKNFPNLKSVIWFRNQKNKMEVEKDYYVSHRYINMIDFINKMEKERW